MLFELTCTNQLAKVYKCQIVPDFTPTRKELRDDLPYYRNFYIMSHGSYSEAQDKSFFKIYQTEEEFDPRNWQMKGAFEVDPDYVANYIHEQDLKLLIMNCCHIAHGTNMPQRWIDAFNAQCFIGWENNMTGWYEDKADPGSVLSAPIAYCIMGCFQGLLDRLTLKTAMLQPLNDIHKSWKDAFLDGELLIVYPSSTHEWTIKELRKK